MSDAPIDRCLERWHEFLRSRDAALLDDLLSDDVVFLSPVVFTPQRGKDVTKLYLTAAGNSLGGEAKEPKEPRKPADEGWDGRFRYARKVSSGHDAVLEFETTVGGKYVNGVDLIRCDDEGRIIEFKVMIRPLQAVNIVHEQMRVMLESIAP
jgi:hypothetical protein